MSGLVAPNLIRKKKSLGKKLVEMKMRAREMAQVTKVL